jgi:adenosine deaminase
MPNGFFYFLIFFAALPAFAGFTPEVDLHTHLGGVLPAKTLINISFADGTFQMGTQFLDAAKIPYDHSKVIEVGGKTVLPFLRENFTTKALEKMEGAMTSSVLNPSDFKNLEVAYDLRRPLTGFQEGHLERHKKFLRAIAIYYKEHGVRYTELSSTANMFTQTWADFAANAIPEIEKETGVKLRFLAGIRRDIPMKEIHAKILDIKKGIQLSPYIVGADFLGEELNPTSHFAEGIRELAEIRKDRPYFQVRVHAGENDKFANNVKDAIKAGATRIGHGVYGVDSETLTLARKNDVIVELNVGSNIALSNIWDTEAVPLQKYLVAGVRVTIGTDGGGIYMTDPSQEIRRLVHHGMAEHWDLVRNSDDMYVMKMNAAFHDWYSGLCWKEFRKFEP